MQRRNACHFLHQYSAPWQLDKKVLFVTQKAVTGHTVRSRTQWACWMFGKTVWHHSDGNPFQVLPELW